MISKLKDDENNSNIDKRKLEEKINKFKNENDKLEDFIEVYNDIVKEEQDKIYNKLNKFKNNMENNMNNLEKKFMDEENNLHAKLNKLNDNVEKINKYNKKKYLDNTCNLDNRIRQLENQLKQNNNLSDVRRGKIEREIKELTKYKNKYGNFLDNIDEIINFIKNGDEKQDNINIDIEKKYAQEFFNFLKNIVEGRNINYLEEEYADMPYLETKEEAAENIADIHERKNNTRKKDDTRKKMIQEKKNKILTNTT